MTAALLISGSILLAAAIGVFLGYRFAISIMLHVSSRTMVDRQEEWIRHRADRAARALRNCGNVSKSDAAGIIAREILGR